MRQYDVAVIGLGAMGAAASYQLARRGARIVGFDRFAPPHANGSSCGDTRVTRLAIGEGEQFVPLAMRSHELWREIERETGEQLLAQVGALIISSAGETAITHVEGFFGKTVAAAEKFGIAHETLDAAAIRRRFPQFAVRDDEYGYFEPGAGYVRPEACIAAQLGLARGRGADLRTNEAVTAIEPSAGGVAVVTAGGRYAADRAIVAAGAWLPELLGDRFGALLRVYRQVQFWFAPEPGHAAAFRPERFPVFIWELQNARQGIYGFPDAGCGVKVASEQFDATTAPKDCDRDVKPDEIAFMFDRLIAPNLTGLAGRCLKSATCLYTVTPDFGFVIDTLPQSERVIVASACSGHGFKHSAAIGEALAELATGGEGRLDLAPFRLTRFSR